MNIDLACEYAPIFDRNCNFEEILLRLWLTIFLWMSSSQFS